MGKVSVDHWYCPEGSLAINFVDADARARADAILRAADGVPLNEALRMLRGSAAYHKRIAAKLAKESASGKR